MRGRIAIPEWKKPGSCAMAEQSKPIVADIH